MISKCEHVGESSLEGVDDRWKRNRLRNQLNKHLACGKSITNQPIPQLHSIIIIVVSFISASAVYLTSSETKQQGQDLPSFLMSTEMAGVTDQAGITLNLAQQAQLATDLRKAINECSERGLYNAAKWLVLGERFREVFN
jgi:hypothetical protein